MTNTAGRPRDLLDALIQQHRAVEYLLNRLRRTYDDGRRDLADQVITILVRHLLLEERLLYPVVRGYLVDGPDRADHAVHEHDQLEVILRELERVDPVDGRFPYTVMDLQTAFMEHIADEESQVFAQLRFAVPADELGRLGDDAEAVERSLGSAPGGPTVNDLLLLSVGAGPGMVDRLRALLEGRP